MRCQVSRSSSRNGFVSPAPALLTSASIPPSASSARRPPRRRPGSPRRGPSARLGLHAVGADLLRASCARSSSRVPRDADVEAALRERDRGRPADPGVAAGDDRDGHPAVLPAASCSMETATALGRGAREPPATPSLHLLGLCRVNATRPGARAGRPLLPYKPAVQRRTSDAEIRSAALRQRPGVAPEHAQAVGFAAVGQPRRRRFGPERGAGSYGRRRAPPIRAGREATWRGATWRCRRRAGPGATAPCSLTQVSSARRVRATRSPLARSPAQMLTTPPRARRSSGRSPVGPVPDERDRGGLARRLDHREHGARDGLAQDPRAGGHAAQHGGRVEGAGESLDARGAAADQLRAAGDRLGDELLDAREVLGRAQRADLRLLARAGRRRSSRTARSRSTPSSGSATDGHADQPARRPPGGARRRRTPPTARRDATVSTGAPSSTSIAPLAGRPGERDDAGAGVRQRRARLLAVDDRQQLLRDARRARSVRAQPLARQRRGRREHDAVAGQQRGGDLERGLRPRRGRRAEHADHAARLLHADRRAGPPRSSAGRPSRRSASAPGPSSASVAEPGDRGQQLAEHRLRARAPASRGRAAARARRARRASAAPRAARSAPARRPAPPPTAAARRAARRRRLAHGRRASRPRPRPAARRSRASGTPASRHRERGSASCTRRERPRGAGAGALDAARGRAARPAPRPKRSSTTSTSGASAPASIAPKPTSVSWPSSGASAHSTCRRAGSKASRRRSSSSVGAARRGARAARCTSGAVRRPGHAQAHGRPARDREGAPQRGGVGAGHRTHHDTTLR